MVLQPNTLMSAEMNEVHVFLPLLVNTSSLQWHPTHRDPNLLYTHHKHLGQLFSLSPSDVITHAVHEHMRNGKPVKIQKYVR